VVESPVRDEAWEADRRQVAHLLKSTKPPFSGPGFVLALVKIRRLVAHIKAIEKDDLVVEACTPAHHTVDYQPFIKSQLALRNQI